MQNLLDYYSRKDVQKAILEASTAKEMAVMYPNGSFGKRPDILQFENDIFELAKSGATSFHISEEHWSNPLLLKPGMTKSNLDSLRTGFDLIIDLDTKFIEFSRLAAQLILDALKFHDIKNIGLKFSGNHGFHLGIPFSSLPQTVNNENLKDLFPDAPRTVAAYLKQMIKEKLSEKILSASSLQEISKALDKPINELLENENFNPYAVVEIDTVLISNRHMYRAPYSVNEKSGLISIPLDHDELKNFNLKNARIENIKTIKQFLPKTETQEASQLLIQAFDALKKNKIEPVVKKPFQTPKTAISSSYFPPCINQGLQGLTDGKKRFLFILYNFLKTTGYPHDAIELKIREWNSKNPEPLSESYLQGQLSWHKRQSQNILPPNCANLSYYQDLGIKCPEEICSRCKNPVNFAKRRYFAELKHKKVKKKTTKKKTSKILY